MPMTFDHYSYCSLGCLYCFAYFFKANNPAISEIALRSVNTEKMIAAMSGKPKDKWGRLYWEHFYSKRFLLHWGGLADPFCNFEKANGVALPLLNFLAEENYPTLFSFKGDAIFKQQYVSLFEAASKQKNFAFQISMVTGDDELAKMVEMGVPPPSKRLDAIRMLSEMGYWTILRLRPYIIGITDRSIDYLLEEAYKAGISGVSMEFLAIDNRTTKGMKDRYDWLAQLVGVDDLQKYFKHTSPSVRGGYMRLNRDVKEAHVRTVYEFCKERGLVCGISDPDFKELNMSGSCCAMPDVYPDNPGLQNWTRSQLTYHMRKVRESYHRTGEEQFLEFGQVYGDESYLDCNDFVEEHVTVIGRCCAERYQLTQRIVLQEQWNNINSPANPRNYFHGKLQPVRLDDEGNYVFRYMPMEYEERWKEEGVDLT